MLLWIGLAHDVLVTLGGVGYLGEHFGQGSGLMSYSAKPLSEPMLIHRQ